MTALRIFLIDPTNAVVALKLSGRFAFVEDAGCMRACNIGRVRRVGIARFSGAHLRANSSILRIAAK
jgi:hypothetical protein